jgi:hypothetical protein
VDQVRELFFERFPDAQSIVDADEKEISEIIKPLGFYNKRAKTWKKFCEQWLVQTRIHGEDRLPLKTLEEMAGIGKYALDSWKVFQLYQYDTKVEDHVLNWYVEWAKKEQENIYRQMNEYRPMTVFYLHFQDERFVLNNWNKAGDYACCVMARTQNEAIDKTTRIAMNQQNAMHIKVIGIGHGKVEWVDEENPMRSDPEYYSRIASRALEMAKKNSLHQN